MLSEFFKSVKTLKREVQTYSEFTAMGPLHVCLNVTTRGMINSLNLHLLDLARNTCCWHTANLRVCSIESTLSPNFQILGKLCFSYACCIIYNTHVFNVTVAAILSNGCCNNHAHVSISPLSCSERYAEGLLRTKSYIAPVTDQTLDKSNRKLHHH